MVTCAGCSCLCTDIVVKDKVFNACRRGASIFRNAENNKAKPKVDGKEVDFDTALNKAIELISNSKNLAVYGLDTVPLEAQELAIKLAEKKEAFIDDNSSFCLGDFVEMILKKEIPTTTLDEVKKNAYVIFYWGTDPYNSLSRHLSLYTYYPRAGKRQRGYEEDRFLVVVDVRKSHTAKLAKKNARFIQVNNDLELIDGFISALDGKAGNYFKDVSRIISEMKRADFNVIFGGLGLKYGLNSDYSRFLEMVNKMNEISNVYFLPAGFHANMRGFNELMFEKTGFVNRYSFREGKASKDFEFKNLILNDEIDTALIIGTDPLNSLPFEVARKLSKIKKIVIDPKNTFTARTADVVLPSAITGYDQGGTMVRSDGVRIEVEPLKEGDVSDISILKRILEGI
ncbi:formylmethanofuran dehydrogenase, subunit B [Archaeoglobus sulfaticallidus PM70-1]|uniref:Formylmethanofuran dehydrogenase, subunit B n=1 Tax=Archaeoglobus sulfaticallidus PM70-1 TaxID=387631 RepID=N0BCR0_9EURY|nr:formylmethanofuran dehydrogenase subunit B [Archaeoglobus sulfaticallidus]AGK60803.1 formylmethanofuran dehydrogenase, subunit B [Archaeoglobus sulfaticallidus PM70-1]